MDIIYSKPLDCYIEITYNTKLSSIRFIRNREGLGEKKTLQASFELEQYFKGERTGFSCDFDISTLSAFTRKVLYETGRIEYGKTITYAELANRIGSRAVRAVGQALAKNPIPIIIPCHRVVAKNGIGGYSAGLDMKNRLLELETKTRYANNL
ncbi:Methylated-DNA--protein-cysteine methyltransferase [uncultured archaeon]|nr:Methylated-DNA--protein-cysteine methyltransferase [uncultured archaeon]